MRGGHASTRSEQSCGAAGPSLSTPSGALPSAIASPLLTRRDLTPTLPSPQLQFTYEHVSTRSEQSCGAAGPSLSTPSDALPSAIASPLLTRNELMPTLPLPQLQFMWACKHAQQAAMQLAFHAFKCLSACRPLYSLCLFSLAMAHAHTATAKQRTHPVASPHHDAAEGPTIIPYPPLVTDIPSTLLVAQGRCGITSQQHRAPCSSITLHSSMAEVEAAHSALTCLHS